MKIRTLALIVGACAVSAGAFADTINVAFTGTGHGRNVRITYGTTSQNVFAGQLKHTLSSGTGAAAAYNGNWLTFCTEVTQHVTSTAKPYDVVGLSLVPGSSPMGAAKASLVTSLYNLAGASALAPAAADDLAAAFQIAVWEIVGDYSSSTGRSSLNLASGWFKATQTDGSALSSGISNYLNTWFNAIGSGTPVTGSVAALGVTNDTSQDQLIMVPAPGAFALAGVGMGLLVRRKRS